MRLSQLHVQNFRSLADVRIDLAPFLCAVGHNNSGKSSLLVAMSLLRSGTKLQESDFYDAARPVEIEAKLDGVDEESLGRLDKKHREKLAEFVSGGTIRLLRRYPGPREKSSLMCFRRLPSDDRFHAEQRGEAIKGSGATLKKNFLDVFPELEPRVAEFKKQSDYEELLEAIMAEMDPEDFVFVAVPLPTGIDQSVIQLLPEVLFIPAVKDVRDDLKTSESAGFGKLISALLSLLRDTPEMQQIEASFEKLNQLINRPADGETDERIEAVRRIESSVGKYVAEQFRDVSVAIEVPPPSVREIFKNARIILDDGVTGDVESKGDGVKRAVTFALLRTFVEMQEEQALSESEGTAADRGRFLFLFEEPELYLHPNAQRILFDALVRISTTHQVCVCTHSPYFFSPEDQGTFIRLRKSDPPDRSQLPPATDVLALQLHGELSKRDLYQVLCYENNSAAFFCDRVLLVEGDCDVIYLQHLAKKLDGGWDFVRRNIGIIKCGGKGAFSRYRSFLEACGVEVQIVADLDALVDGFQKLNPTTEETKLRARLLQEADKLIKDNVEEQKTDRLKSLAAKNTFREKYEMIRSAVKAFDNGETVDADSLPSYDDLFAEEQNAERRRLIGCAPQLESIKFSLLRKLAERGVYVLSRGAIEVYYPANATGKDKTSRAIDACGRVKCRNDAVACSDVLDIEDSDTTELENVFAGIFGESLDSQAGRAKEAVEPGLIGTLGHSSG